MAVYWLDSNVFIEAMQGPYAIDIAPGFWQWLKQQTVDGRVRSPSAVLGELAKQKDELAGWVKKMKPDGLFVQPSKSAQEFYGRIVQSVSNSYETAASDKFLADADPWVIAAASDDSGIVVTHEVLAGTGSKKIKIPNVCNACGVNWIHTYDMLRSLGLKLK